MLINLLNRILAMSMSAAIAAVGIVVIRALLKRRIRPTLQFALWFLLVTVCLIPIRFSGILNIFNVIPKLEQTELVMYTPENPVMEFTSEKEGELAIAEEEIPKAHQTSKTTVSTFSVKMILALVWIIGFGLLFLFFAAVYGYTWHQVRRKGRPAGVELQLILQQCRDVAGVKAEIIVTDYFDMPFLFGVLSPVIVIPSHVEEGFTFKQIQNILFHELTHIRRKDVLINHMIYFIKALHWFNPLVWYSTYLMRNDSEKACDYQTVRQYSQEDRAYYAQTILKCSTYKKNRLLTVVGFSEHVFQERIMIIMKNKKYKIITAVGATSLAAVLAIGCLSIPISNAASNESVDPLSNPILSSESLAPETTPLMEELTTTEAATSLMEESTATVEPTTIIEPTTAMVSTEPVSEPTSAMAATEPVSEPTTPPMSEPIPASTEQPAMASVQNIQLPHFGDSYEQVLSNTTLGSLLETTTEYESTMGMYKTCLIYSGVKIWFDHSEPNNYDGTGVRYMVVTTPGFTTPQGISVGASQAEAESAFASYGVKHDNNDGANTDTQILWINTERPVLEDSHLYATSLIFKDGRLITMQFYCLEF